MDQFHGNCTNGGSTTVLENDFINLSVAHKVEVTMISAKRLVSIGSPDVSVDSPHVGMDVSMGGV